MHVSQFVQRTENISRCAILTARTTGDFCKITKTRVPLGRACAAEALFKLGGPVEQALFKVSDDRLPIWPKDWIGSISHSPVGAIAIVGKSSFTPVLGIDMHWMRDLPADLSAFRLVAKRSEYAFVDRLSPTERHVLIFSAKEALYKALFPVIRDVLDFSAARVSAFSLGTITLKLRHNWNHIFQKIANSLSVGVCVEITSSLYAVIISREKLKCQFLYKYSNSLARPQCHCSSSHY